jgi:hypothetical protein
MTFIGKDKGHHFIRIGIEKHLYFAQVIFHRAAVEETLTKFFLKKVHGICVVTHQDIRKL